MHSDVVNNVLGVFDLVRVHIYCSSNDFDRYWVDVIASAAEIHCADLFYCLPSKEFSIGCFHGRVNTKQLRGTR